MKDSSVLLGKSVSKWARSEYLREIRQTAGKQRIASCVSPRDYRLQSSAHLLPCDFEFALKQKAKNVLISPDLFFIYKTRDQDEIKNPWTVQNMSQQNSNL